MEEKAQKKRLNILITSDLHKELKVAAAQEGVTLCKYVTDAIKEKIEKSKKG